MSVDVMQSIAIGLLAIGLLAHAAWHWWHRDQ